jgi:hypothetical protein
LEYFNYDYVIIETEWKGFGTKIIETYNWLKQFKEDYTHFIFLDGHDTFMLSNIKEIEEKYTKMDSPSMFFSCERACWPDSVKELLYPDTISDWKYLNSGQYMANIDKFIEIVEKNKPSYDIDDQRFFTSLFLEGFEITLDYFCEIFQSIAFRRDADFVYGHFDLARLLNTVTGSKPCSIHGNGKTDMQEIYKLIP